MHLKNCDFSGIIEAIEQGAKAVHNIYLREKSVSALLRFEVYDGKKINV